MAIFKKKNKHSHEEDDWSSVSDLMAGLMMVFLFISISLMMEAKKKKQKITDVAVSYQKNQVNLYNELNEEFKNDLEKWKATLNKEDLTFTFISPDTLFANNKSELKEEYKKVLKEFFPRYLNIVLKFKNSIDEIRIEGHTSSLGGYFHNMQLSQDRTRAVLEYVYNLNETNEYKNWIVQHIAAVGLSSSKPILKDNKEDESASRRVSFRVITNSEIQMRKILEVE
jgi:outer membrane protein OmpA-like peptidoglycan-associated protein